MYSISLQCYGVIIHIYHRRSPGSDSTVQEHTRYGSVAMTPAQQVNIHLKMTVSTLLHL